MTFTLPGRVPSKKNSKKVVCRGSRPYIFPSQAYEAWHEEMMLRLRKHRPKKPLTFASVEAVFYPPDRIKADCTNKMESIMDLLVDAGFLEDDNWFVVPAPRPIFRGVDTKNPRVEITITALNHEATAHEPAR